MNTSHAPLLLFELAGVHIVCGLGYFTNRVPRRCRFKRLRTPIQ
jgi:hypothetical protein